MKERESSSHGRSREEVMYWRNLTPLFKVDLHANFHSALEIPLYFSENVKGKLPHKVALKGPSVDDLDTWEVQLKTSNDTTWFVGDGWKEFVAAFSLEENDTLVFKYKRNSHFKVTIFNGKTSCEKESSHFVMKSDSHQAKESSSQAQKTKSLKQGTKSETKKRNIDELSSISRKHKEPVITSEDVEIVDDESLEDSLQVNCKNVRDATEPEAEYISKPSNLCSREKTMKEVLRARQQLEKTEEPTAFCRNVKVKTEPEADFISTSLTSREKAAILRARQRAEAIRMLTDNSFYKALSRSHVSGPMKLSIPRQWWNEVINSKSNKCVKLRVKGKEDYDPYMYICSYDASNQTGKITTGWKKFVQENSLYEHDCCVFSLTKPLEEDSAVIHLEVEIVRAELGVSQDN